MTQKPPKEFDALADVVLAYRPKPKSRPAKKTRPPQKKDSEEAIYIIPKNYAYHIGKKNSASMRDLFDIG